MVQKFKLLRGTGRIWKAEEPVVPISPDLYIWKGILGESKWKYNSTRQILEWNSPFTLWHNCLLTTCCILSHWTLHSLSIAHHPSTVSCPISASAWSVILGILVTDLFSWNLHANACISNEKKPFHHYIIQCNTLPGK